MRATDFRSESGLRPASAFLMIACVLIAVSANAVRIALLETTPSDARVVRSPEPDFDIVDRTGKPLAFSVRRLDLVLSPRAAWRAHTPDFMAGLIADVLGESCRAEELLGKFLPELDDGIYFIPQEKLTLSREQAERVCALLERGIFAEEDEPRPLDGVYVVASGTPEKFLLGWEPEFVLSKACRKDQIGDEVVSIAPIAWTNRLMLELSRALRGGDVERANETEMARARMRAADQLWDLLMPSGHEIALLDLPLDRAYELLSMLEKQGLKSHQMELRSRVARTWPQRECEGGEESLEILGRWGHLDTTRATALVEHELGYERPHVDAGVAAANPKLLERVREFDNAYGHAVDSLHPVSGIERTISTLLKDPTWDFLERASAKYRFREYHCARPRASHRYFVDACASSEPPRAKTTIDLDLQRFLRRHLDAVMEEHDPALAMAIVVDVDSAEVLAVDGVSAYEVKAFLPTWHLFTPGSTFKAIVMATALDAGVVTPDQSFEAHRAVWRIPGTGRTIREAQGEIWDTATASEGLAYSLNVVLTQIGLLMDPEPFRAKLEQLGYMERPNAELGTERRGYIPKLPWKKGNAHASVSFGHEIQVSLWQHAEALATVLRGGDRKALRLVSEVEQNGVVYEVPAEPGIDDVFGQEACIQVREMMYMGAQVGTGKALFDERVWMGTKTGTAEKVRTELCLHTELAHNREHQLEHQKNPHGDAHVCYKNCRRKLHSIPKSHKSSCYTSSICAFGRLPNSEREVMVLCVVDEPRKKEKFGSRVAGPAGCAILFEALGLTRNGLAPEEWAQTTVEYSDENLNVEDHPWAEVLR